MKKICASIESIEKGLLLDIVERVVCGSFKDLINLRLSEESVYEKVPFADFPLFSWSVRTRDQIDKRACFVNQCMKAGNREALYKIGMRDLKKKNCPELALQRLREAKKGGHNSAAYVLAIISIFVGGGDSRAVVRFIGHMKGKFLQRKEIKQWRKSLIYMIDNVWVSNPIFFTERPKPCCTGEHENSVQVNGWPVDSDDEQDDQPCYECGWDDEIDHVFALLPKFGF